MKMITENEKRLQPILALGLPYRMDLPDAQNKAYLRRKYTQTQLRAYLDSAFSVMCKMDYESPEWDILTEAMDYIWNALAPNNRP